MAYFTDLFTVETYEAFLASDRTVSGFRENQTGMTRKIVQGDKLLAYIKGLSRWAAVLEVREGPFVDRSPLFVPQNDPFVVRFNVNPSVALPLDQSVPIRDERVFNTLSFTRGNDEGYWLGPLRRSLQHIDESDGRFLERVLTEQVANPTSYPLAEEDVERLRPKQVRRIGGTVGVTVPRDDPVHDSTISAKAGRESIRNQADLARLGELMGFRIWLPKNDRAAVAQHWQASDGSLLDSLPLNYDLTTLETIEQIDVLWLRGARSRGRSRSSIPPRFILGSYVWRICSHCNQI